MSNGAVAITAIIVSGTQGTVFIAAGAWLIHARRIVFAATPKPPVQQAGQTAGKKQDGPDATGQQGTP
jgi:hypothetical protein